MFKKLVLCVMVSVLSAHAAGSVVLLNGTSSAGKSSICTELKSLFIEDAVFWSIDYIAWAPLIEEAIRLGLIDEQMTIEEQCEIMLKHIEQLFLACDSQWFGRLQKLYDHVRELALTHRYVVFDTVLYDVKNKDVEYFWQQMQGIHVFSVLIYCSPAVMAQRVMQRNSGTAYEQKRDIISVIQSFCDLYAPAYLENEAIGILTVREVEDALSIIRNHLLESGTSDDLAEQKITDLRALYLKTFFAGDQKAVAIAPRFAHDFVIHTSELPSQECAQLIYDEFMKRNGNAVS